MVEEKFEEIIVERGVREESVSKEEITTATKEQVVEKKESIIEQSAAIISKESFTQKVRSLYTISLKYPIII